MRQSMKSLSLVMLLLLSVCSSMFIVTDVAEANTVVITEAVQVVDGGAASDQQSAVGSDSEGNVHLLLATRAVIRLIDAAILSAASLSVAARRDHD